MAVTKILARHARLDLGINYILNGDKTEEYTLTAHLNCDPGRECHQMLDTKRAAGSYGKMDGMHCPCPVHFAECKPFGKSADWTSKAPQVGWVIVPAYLRQHSVFRSDFLGKPCSSTTCRSGCLYDYGVVKSSHQLFQKNELFKSVPISLGGSFLCGYSSC